MRLRIGNWLVKPDMGDLVSDGQSLHVSPKAMEVLLFLARRQGHVVGKEELFETLWNGVFVTDDALTRCIGEIRRAFRDDARDPWLIQTIAKRGYMLLPPVAWESDTDPKSADESNSPYAAEPFPGEPPAASRTRTRWSTLTLAGVALAIVFVFSFAAWRLRTPSRYKEVTSKPRLAVLPLVNLSGDPQQEYFADGMTEQLITELAHIDSWEVISRTSVMSYKGTKQPLPEVARNLAADWLVEGTVQRSGEHVRITAQLIDAKSDQHLWSGSFDSKLSDMLTLESEFASRIATELKLNPAAYPGRQHGLTAVPAAYEAYLKGRYFYNQSQYTEAASYFEQATVHDPNFALAYAMLWEADAMSTFPTDDAPPPRALKAARRAIELDDSLSEAHLVNGDLKFYGEWDFVAGEAEFRRAVELNPNSTDAIVHHAGCLHVLRQWDQSISEYRRALHIDPASPQLNRWFFEVLANSGRYEEALEQFHKTIELNPADGFAYLRAGDVFHQQGRDAEAVAAYLKAESLVSSDAILFDELKGAAGRGGYEGYWRKRLELNKQVPQKIKASSIGIAAMFVRVGEYDKALDLLEAAYAKHSPALVWIAASAVWQPLQGNPRYQSLLSRMRLSVH